MAKIPEIGRIWWDEFRGRCEACRHAFPSSRKCEMICSNDKARNRGLDSRPGGSWNGDPVHRLYGCVFFLSAEPKGRVVPKNRVEPIEEI